MILVLNFDLVLCLSLVFGLSPTQTEMKSTGLKKLPWVLLNWLTLY